MLTLLTALVSSWIMNYPLEILKIGGGIAGLLALIWRLWDEFASHLRIAVKVEGPKDGWLSILTTVENKTNRDKDISYAMLLIGPETESPLVTARRLAKKCGYGGRLEFTNDLADFRVEHAIVHDSRLIIPLRFYYEENICIGDETLTYRVPISSDKLEPGAPFSVRFFLFPAHRLHRSTQDCFVNLLRQEKILNS